MDERDTQDPLRDLGERLDKVRRGRQRQTAGAPGGGMTEDSRSGLALAFRIGVELVVAVVVGVAIGWAFDKVLSTRPLGMIVFFFLGVGVGMWNVYRAVTGMGMAMGYRRGARQEAEPRKQQDWSDDED